MKDGIISRLFGKKSSKPIYSYNPEKEYPIIRASICTGEAAAGFKNRIDGSFREIMLIRNEQDKNEFMDMYGLSEVKKEY